MSSRDGGKLYIVPTYLLYIIYGYLLNIILHGQEPQYKIISIIALNATFVARRIISLDRINCGKTRQRFLRAKHCLETYCVKDLYSVQDSGSRKIPAALAKNPSDQTIDITEWYKNTNINWYIYIYNFSMQTHADESTGGHNLITSYGTKGFQRVETFW